MNSSSGSPAVLPPTSAIAVLRDQIAPNASDGELAYFAQVCQRLDLSPFADQIVLIGRYDKRLNRTVHRHQITVAGRRTLAERTGLLTGIEGPVWCGPRNQRGDLDWRDVWDDDKEPPYCARVLVHVKAWVTPANGTAKWAEFAQYDNNGRLLPLWKTMPSHMLGKVAESMALRRAFPDVIDRAVVDANYYSLPGDDLAELGDALADHGGLSPEGETATAPPSGEPSDEPSNQDQAEAHRIIGALDDDSQERFLADWRIDDFGSWWPADAIADALSRST